MKEEKFWELKQEVERARSEAERAKGALDQLYLRLKKDFDCANLKEARELLKKLLRKEEEAQEAYERAVKDYESKWKKKP